MHVVETVLISQAHAVSSHRFQEPVNDFRVLLADAAPRVSFSKRAEP